MPRKIGHCPDAPSKVDPHPGTTTKRYAIQVITPLFGGGVEPGVNDPVTLIRAPSIRGHLRFWWRATCGARCATVQKLREREVEVWGSTENPSPVQLEVSQPRAVERRSPPSYDFQKYGPEAYVLFSAKQNNNVLCKEDGTFTLTVRWPNGSELQRLRELENAERRKKQTSILPEKIEPIGRDIEAAVWAWVNFGGIGARTRRGCGALYCKELAPSNPDMIGNWMSQKLKEYDIQNQSSPHLWPTLSKTLLLRISTTNPMGAWSDAIKILQEFRQGKGVGRNTGNNVPGRSRWPEAESVRELVCQQNSLRQRPQSWHKKDERMKTLAFPRAEFGMPIIIELRGEEVVPSQRRNKNIKPTLQPKESSDRMASPLILRPICFGNGQNAAMIIRMQTAPLTSAYLKPGKDDLKNGVFIQESKICEGSLSEYQDSPMKGRSNGSAIEAFLAFAKEKGFQEVRL